MKSINYERARAMVSMLDVMRLLDMRIGVSKRTRWPCPIHGSKKLNSRSLSISVVKKCFRCFKCDAHGNHLDLYAKVTEQELYPATLELFHKLNFDVPLLTYI
jgi:DNA primase